MPIIYSLNGAAPGPLPHRIRIPDGTGGYCTRTDASTFTEAELEAAGYVLADAPPEHVPATHHPAVWNGSSWDDPVAKSSAELAAERAPFARETARLQYNDTIERRARKFDRAGDGLGALKLRLKKEI